MTTFVRNENETVRQHAGSRSTFRSIAFCFGRHMLLWLTTQAIADATYLKYSTSCCPWSYPRAPGGSVTVYISDGKTLVETISENIWFPDSGFTSIYQPLIAQWVPKKGKVSRKHATLDGLVMVCISRCVILYFRSNGAGLTTFVSTPTCVPDLLTGIQPSLSGTLLQQVVL